MSEAAAAPAGANPPDDEAAAAAAAAKAAEEQKPAPLDVTDPPPPPTPDPKEGVVIEYNPTGDVGLDLALRFVGERGFSPEHPAIQAAQKGDFGPIAEALKGMGDKAKGYQQYLTAAKESFERRQSANAAKAKATEDAVVKAAGGVANWNAVHAWVKAEASDAEKAEINAAFSAGPLVAAAMARDLAERFKQTGNSKAAPKSAASPNAAAAPASAASGALSPDEFKREYVKLVAKYGDSKVASTKEYADIVARRRAFTK